MLILSDMFDWIKKYWVLSVCVPWVSEEGELHVSMQGVYQEEWMVTLHKLCWYGTWSLQSDEKYCLLLTHSLRRSNLHKNIFVEFFYLSFLQHCTFLLGFSSFSTSSILNLLFQWLLKKQFGTSWEAIKTFFNFRSNRIILKSFIYETFIN